MANSVIKWSLFNQKEFDEWKEGYVSMRDDGSYSTQDALYRNSVKDITALKCYFIKEFLN